MCTSRLLVRTHTSERTQRRRRVHTHTGAHLYRCRARIVLWVGGIQVVIILYVHHDVAASVGMGGRAAAQRHNSYSHPCSHTHARARTYRTHKLSKIIIILYIFQYTCARPLMERGPRWRRTDPYRSTRTLYATLYSDVCNAVPLYHYVYGYVTTIIFVPKLPEECSLRRLLRRRLFAGPLHELSLK